MFYYLSRSVKPPEIGHKGDAGIDFFVPFYTPSFVRDVLKINPDDAAFFSVDANQEKILKVNPHRSVLIPSGVYVNFSVNRPMALIAHNKSGIASSKSLDVLACVVDQTYQGEVHIHLHNNRNQEVVIKQAEKIVQYIRHHIDVSPIYKVDSMEELYEVSTPRGKGGFGSTNKKSDYDINIR